jgi:RNA polymerase sigma-70 factor (ECF subfamily)
MVLTSRSLAPGGMLSLVSSSVAAKTNMAMTNSSTTNASPARPQMTATAAPEAGAGTENVIATTVPTTLAQGEPSTFVASPAALIDDSEKTDELDSATVEVVDDMESDIQEGQGVTLELDSLDAAPLDETLSDLEDEDEEEQIAPVKVISPEKLAFLETLQRAKDGDLKAFEEIYQLYHRRIYNAVYGMLSDPDDAQDVTQDVFMRLHDALPTLRADEAFSTYLYRIALNLCRDRARRKKRVRFQSIDTPREGEDGDVEPMDFPDPGKLPEETLTNVELQNRVREAVTTLSTDHKAVIVMHHFQGMEVNDIARILGVPTGTVKSRLARGRDQLHRKLRSYLNV